MAKNPYYVYALKDPRTNPMRPFYIGKGKGRRIDLHVLKVDKTEKGKTIKAILDAGLQVEQEILVGDLTEGQALKIEAELIAAFGVTSQGGLLTNTVKPNTNNISEKLSINVPAGTYEKAQLGLELLKNAVVELAKANKDGLRNADVAKSLGIQSAHGGEDFLSYSILGLLIYERQIIKVESGKRKSKYYSAKQKRQSGK